METVTPVFKIWQTRTFVPLLVCLVCVLGRGSYIHAAELLEQGSTIVIRCPLSGKSSSASDTIVQMIKKQLTLDYPMAKTSNSFSGPFTISNNTDIQPGLLNQTSRYSVTEEGGMYTLTITDAQPEDSGEWVCERLSEFNAVTTASTRDFIVIGPLKSVSWRTVSASTMFDTTVTPNNSVLVQGAVVTINQTNGRFGQPTEAADLICDVLFTNVAPQVQITIGRFGEEDTDNITNWFWRAPFGDTTIYNGGLIFHVQRWRYEPSSTLWFKPEYHGRELHCRASLPSKSMVMDKYVLLHIPHSPIDVTCGYLGTVRFPRGTQAAEITCNLQGNPTPAISWQLPDSTIFNALHPLEGYNVSTTVHPDRVRVTTTLTIADVDLKDYGTFNVVAKNKYGSRKVRIGVAEGPVDSGADTNTLVARMAYLVLLLIVSITQR